MPLYRANAEFGVGSRIGWEDRDDDIAHHLDAMVVAIRDRAEVGFVELDFDRTRDLLSVEVVCHVPETDQDPDHAVRRVLAEAVRDSGGRPEGLLSIGEESKVTPRQNQWSGLRTLQWKLRVFNIRPETDREDSGVE